MNPGDFITVERFVQGLSRLGIGKIQCQVVIAVSKSVGIIRSFGLVETLPVPAVQAVTIGC